MPDHQIAAVVATIIQVLMMIFQLLLAAGLPCGAAAWGGTHRVLPMKLRWASLASVGVLGIATGLLLLRSGLIGSHADDGVVRAGVWTFTAFLGLNTAGNLASRSRVERFVMTPTTFVLVVCFFLVARS